MTRRNFNRVLRAMLALLALVLAGYEYSLTGFNASLALYLFLAALLGLQAAAGAG